MRQFIDEYLEDQRSAWSETTLKSEKSRLNGLAQYMGMTPAEIYKALVLEGRKPYSIKTAFIRLCNLEGWANKKGLVKETPFKEYMTRHKNKFKYAYTKEDVGMSYTEAMNQINKLEEPYQSMAKGMLETGVRISEAYNIKDGKVIGKGGKPRTVYGKISKTAPRSTFARKLKAVGLRPHDLRKLCATRLVEKGATSADLCKVFGWSSINTSFHYLQSRDDERLQALIQSGKKGK